MNLANHRILFTKTKCNTSKFSLLFFFFIAIIHNISAQKLHYELPDNANKMYNSGNYLKAKELYRELYKNNQKNIEYKFRFGVSLLYTYEWEDGVKILEEVSKKVDAPKEIWFYLGKGYHLTNRYDLAIKTIEKFIKLDDKSPLVEDGKTTIKMCENAKEIIKKPLNVTFENLGDAVNSKGKEFLPFISPSEDLLIYSTRREGTTGKIYDLEGYYTADIYLSSFKTIKWSKARSYGYPNSYGNELVAGYSENGNYILFYVDNPKEKNQLQIAEKSKKSFLKSKKIDEKSIINKNNNKEITATISDDGMTMVFSSDKNEKINGSDLYIVKKLPNGKWAEPTSIGEQINTKLDENFPYLTNNGKTLYFASKGHNSIGGYDIFISQFDEELLQWSKPTNIGYPINTPDDDMSICFTQDKKTAYIASYRKDSKGDLDIYKVKFNDDDGVLTTIKGVVLKSDSSLVSTSIEAFNELTGDLQGVFEVNNNKGSFIMILPPNKYILKFALPNGNTIEKKLWIKDGKDAKKLIQQDFILEY